MAKKSKASKVLGAIVAVALIGRASVYGYKLYKDYIDSSSSQTQVQTLETPNNFAFDKESYVLTWDEVENAEGYTILYNGQDIDVPEGETSQEVILLATQNTFQIKANGDGENFKDSSWSDVISYTVENTAELELFDKINIELNRAVKNQGYTLDTIVGISFAETGVDSKICGIDISMIGTKNDKQYELIAVYDMQEASSKLDLLNQVNEDNYTKLVSRELVSYDSAQKLLANKKYVGQTKTLADGGYDISMLDSYVRQGRKVSGDFRYEIVGTYKAVLGDDVKYFTSVNQITVLNPQNEKYNYETSLEFANKVEVVETQFVMHEAGGTLEYMLPLIEFKQNTTTETHYAKPCKNIQLT